MRMPKMPPEMTRESQLGQLKKMCESDRYKEEVKFWYEFTTTPRTRYLNDLLRSAANELELKYQSETTGRYTKNHLYVFVGEARYVKVLIESIESHSS